MAIPDLQQAHEPCTATRLNPSQMYRQANFRKRGFTSHMQPQGKHEGNPTVHCHKQAAHVQMNSSVLPLPFAARYKQQKGRKGVGDQASCCLLAHPGGHTCMASCHDDHDETLFIR
eukprot:1158495-Pelagomonas_calceolata.AAC.1